jgi:hypothetical protein
VSETPIWNYLMDGRFCVARWCDGEAAPKVKRLHVLVDPNDSIFLYLVGGVPYLAQEELGVERD